MTRVRDASGYRLRAACVAFNSAGTHILLVSAAKRVGAWVLPAGGVELGESAGESALRELWEEAGARATCAGPALFLMNDHAKRARTTFFAARIDTPLDELYPEAKMRTREWILLADAPGALASSPAAHAALLAVWDALVGPRPVVDQTPEPAAVLAALTGSRSGSTTTSARGGGGDVLPEVHFALDCKL
jgi:diphosphoinositol-polyphosphate diphosphatase